MQQFANGIEREACRDRLRDGDLRESEAAGRRLLLSGGVQGHGVRPAIYRLATELELSGTVANTPAGVEIFVGGEAWRLAEFERRLIGSLPNGARPERIEAESAPPLGEAGFVIVVESGEGRLATPLPVDLAVCPECAAECRAPDDRRFGYPLGSCTRCGPRFTVIERMPFERRDTPLETFPLCERCSEEYTDSSDRRFFAQTTTCPRCGPGVFTFSNLAVAAGVQRQANGIEAAAALLRGGGIVAIRGLGGYQLLADATSGEAVARLRRLKRRLAKPLAVMVESAAAARRMAEPTEAELAAFDDPSGPIVLMEMRHDAPLAREIQDGLKTVGLMRPTTPWHVLLAAACERPLVCTSGNVEGEPLEYETRSAERRLAGMCDLTLHHEREIVRPIDDSVVRVIAGRRVTIRLARGLAPLRLALPRLPPMIALGGYLKAAVAWSNGCQSALGPHLGDQDHLSARERFLAHLEDVQRLYRFRPERLVHDMHPGYASTQWAQEQPLPRTAVQHHHAHIAAGMLEQGWLDRRVLGVAWDGTGFGPDGTIWGGEFLVATTREYVRVARLRPMALVGGEMAIRQPWRCAVSACGQIGETIDAGLRQAWGVDEAAVANVQMVARRPGLAIWTSSAGRLLDAAAAIVLGIGEAKFDGQAAMRLEAASDRAAVGEYPLALGPCETIDGLVEVDWRPMLERLLADRRKGCARGAMAMRVHRGLARCIVEVSRRWPELATVLSGGVFQNRLLTELTAELWRESEQPLGLPGMIPPNDGGLAAGQLVVAAAGGGLETCA